MFVFSDCCVHDYFVLIEELQLLQELGLRFEFGKTTISTGFLTEVKYYCRLYESLFTNRPILFDREINLALRLHMKLHPVWYRTFINRLVEPFYYW